jgi:outer membrane protein OmpA-like peptidoglycan-associated protein
VIDCLDLDRLLSKDQAVWKLQTWPGEMRRINAYASALLVVLAATSVSSTGCDRTGKGGAIGAGAGGAVGAGVGAIAGGKKGAAIGAIIGATVGGATGAMIGRHMDKRAEQLAKDLENAKVERVGEGILVTFESGILFDTDEATLRPAAKQNIQELAEVLERYDDTDVVIVGHTDSTGPADYNRDLSKRRAESVAAYAARLGLEDDRVRIAGDGETAPVAPNSTVEGRQQNRRVEVAIIANEDMREAIAQRE